MFIAFHKSSQHGGDTTTNQETDKGSLTKDAMSIVGKYFKSPADYANLSKLSKKYNDITGYYHYNPISTPHDLFPNMQTYEICTEDQLELNYRPGIKPFSSCRVPEEVDLDDPHLDEEDYKYYSSDEHRKYCEDYYYVLNDFITKLNILVEKYPHVHVFKYLPPIYFNFELLKVSEKVIFENITGMVPYGVDIKRFKTIYMGLGDKSLIGKLKTKLNTEITEAVIPEGIIYLEDMLGYDKLTSIELPSTLTSIYLDNECPNLHNLSLPDGMDLEMSLIKNSNINNISVCAKNSVEVTRMDIKNRDKLINITFRKARQYNEDLSISLNDPNIYNYIMENNNVILFVKDGELYFNNRLINALYIDAEDEINLRKIPNHGLLSSCEEIPSEPNSDYYKNYYKTIYELIIKLNDLAKKDYKFIVYCPKINFDAELLHISKKVIFKNIRGMVPYGVDIKRFKTTTMGLSDKSLIKKLNLNTKITEAIIPEGIVYLHDMNGYSKLTSIQLPSTLKNIQINNECPNLHDLYLPDGMDLRMCFIKNSNINNVNIDAENEVVVDSDDEYKQPITITFRNVKQPNYKLSYEQPNIKLWVVFNNNSKLDEYIKEEGIVSLSIINSEICANGQPISKL